MESAAVVSAKQLKANYYANKKAMKKTLSASQYNKWEKESILRICNAERKKK